MTSGTLVSRSAVGAPLADEKARWLGTTWRRGLVFVGAVALACGLAVVDTRPVGVVHDDAMYVILARSLATGQGYRFLNVPGHPAATHFPPGYPAVLAAVSWLTAGFPSDVVAFKALNGVFLGAAAILIALLARRVVSERWALALGLASAVSVPLLLLGSMVLSEPLFLVLVLAVLLWLESFAEQPGNTAHAAMLGVVIAACTLVRAHGIVLIPAAALALVLRGRRGDAAVLTASAVLCLLPWQLWAARHSGTLPAPLLGNYDSYASWWLRGVREMGPMMVPRTVAKTTRETTDMLGALFAPIRGAMPRELTIGILLAFAVGGVAAGRRRLPITLLFLGGYAGIVAIWPFAPARFVWGVWPLVLLLVAMGAHWAMSRPTPMRMTAFAALAWIVIGYGAYEVRAARGEWWSSIARANTPRIASLVRWTSARTQPGDVVATDDEGAVYLYTGRQSVPVFSFTAAHYLRDHTVAEEADEGLIPILAAYPVTTVVAGTRTTLDVARQLTQRPAPRLAPREEFPGGAAFTVLPQ
ncbi:MAG TPA: hypothetical protein VGG84_09345 [Gemmatimonadaceae bacterium]